MPAIIARGKLRSRHSAPLRQRVQNETHQNRENQGERHNDDEDGQGFAKCQAGNDYW
jgi:hypothetical protein